MRFRCAHWWHNDHYVLFLWLWLLRCGLSVTVVCDNTASHTRCDLFTIWFLLLLFPGTSGYYCYVHLSFIINLIAGIICLLCTCIVHLFPFSKWLTLLHVSSLYCKGDRWHARSPSVSHLLCIHSHGPLLITKRYTHSKYLALPYTKHTHKCSHFQKFYCSTFMMCCIVNSTVHFFVFVIRLLI